MFIETRLIRDKIYFIPSTSNYIVIYYLKDSTFIIKPLKYKSICPKFISSFVDGKYLVIPPFNYNAIIKVNILTDEIDEIENKEGINPAWITYVFPYNSKQEFRSTKFTKNDIYTFSKYFDKVERKKIEEIDYICGYYCDGDIEYILGIDSIIIKINNLYIHEIAVPKPLSGALKKMIKISNFIFIFPMLDIDNPDCILVFDTDEKQFICDFDNIFGVDEEVCNFAKIIENKLFWDSLSKKAIMSYDFEAKVIQKYSCSHDYDYIREFKGYSLNDFINREDFYY